MPRAGWRNRSGLLPERAAAVFLGFSFWESEFIVGSLDDPFHLAGRRRRCMTDDDSVQIAATSPARRRAFARVRSGVRTSGRDVMRDVVASADGRTPVARKIGSAARSRRKFSASQSLENSQNAEGISILREAVPWAGGTPGAKEEGATHGWYGSRAGCSRPGSRVGGDPEPIVDLSSQGALVAGISTREADGKSRREIAPQPIEKIESAPGNCMVSEASNPQGLVQERAADRAQERQDWRGNFQPAKP
jgi:hypothetical protein